MFQRIVVDNFKSFSHLEFDLRGPRSKPLHYAMVYGENGSGKTNLMESVSFLKRTLTTVTDSELYDASVSDEGNHLAGTVTNLPRLCSQYRMIGSDEPMHIRYEFELGGRRGDYDLTFDIDGNLVREELRHSTSKGSLGRYFLIEKGEDGPEISWGRGVFGNALSRSLKKRAQKLWGRNTMLAILVSEYLHSNEEFMERCTLPGVGDVLSFMTSVTVNLDPYRGKTPYGTGVPIDLRAGCIDVRDTHVLDAYEDVLSSYLVRLCTDIKEARYLRTSEGDRIRYELCLIKEIAGVRRSIPVDRESSGTRRIIDLFPVLMACASGGVAFIDGLDSGIHDRMVHDLMEQVLPEMTGQLVITTHDTMMLETAEPRNVFVIRIDRHGFKDLSSLQSISPGRKGRKTRVDYMNGLYGGVPIISSLGLKGLAERLSEELEDI